MFKLVIQDDEGKTTVVPLLREELTIGRKEGNTIRLTERNVSRRHAKVYRQNGSISIEDLDSYNGIRVNGARIQGRVELKETDRVQIGDYLIEIKTDAVAKPDSEEATQPIERVDALKTAPLPVLTDTVPTLPTRKAPEGTSPGTPVAAIAEPLAADTEPAAAPLAGDAQQVGRLVALSSNFAGEEFELTKPAMVIGRTDENDIWINHRSISRHHAKVVRENGRYAILDLQSSNGVRVNGEEYGKVELRRGDVIDLGHVRLRFVEPGEDFLFGRDAQAVDLPTGGGNHMALWALLAMVVVGGAVTLMFVRPGFLPGGEDEEETVEPAPPRRPDRNPPVQPSRNPSTDAGLAVTPPAPDEPDATAVEPPPIEPKQDAAPRPDFSRRLAQARQAIEAENWAAAEEAARDVLAGDAQNAEAKALAATAQSEAKNAEILERIRKCGGPPCVQAEFQNLEEKSVYYKRATPLVESAKRRYLETMGRRATTAFNSAKDRESCNQALREIAREANTLWSEAGDRVNSVRAGCDNKPPRVVEEDPVETGEDPETKARKLVAEASESAKAGQWGKAARSCKNAVRISSGNQDAVTVCALAACKLHRGDDAREYYGKLRNTQKRNMIRQACLQEGVDDPSR